MNAMAASLRKNGSGNGKSDRPSKIEAYSLENYVVDALAVMDETATDKAILVSLFDPPAG